MLRKQLLICLLILGHIATKAQVSMTLQVPPMGVLVKSQLWNMLLVNSGNYSIQARINLVLMDEKTNQPVLTANSIPILLGKGARQLQARDLSPIQYTYNIPSSNADGNPDGLLPIGNYQACYTVVNLEKTGIIMVENCIQVNVDPLSPPLLNSPADEGLVTTPYPQFTWLPPTPPGMFNDLNYEIILVEVLPGQGKGDAVQQNPPVYSAGYVKNQYVNYPSSYQALDTSKLYAWRILALNNGQPAAMSDIWTFKVTGVKPTFKKEASVYIDLKRNLDASIASSGEILKLAYYNTTSDTLVRYSIISLGDAGNPIIQQGQILVHRGQNLLDLPLQRSSGFGQNKPYLFKLISGRKESWTVKFTWSPDSVE